jgi:hypothetical protein
MKRILGLLLCVLTFLSMFCFNDSAAEISKARQYAQAGIARIAAVSDENNKWTSDTQIDQEYALLGVKNNQSI